MVPAPMAMARYRDASRKRRESMAPVTSFLSTTTSLEPVALSVECRFREWILR